jgi:hypothetical protein
MELCYFEDFQAAIMVPHAQISIRGVGFYGVADIFNFNTGDGSVGRNEPDLIAVSELDCVG